MMTAAALAGASQMNVDLRPPCSSCCAKSSAWVIGFPPLFLVLGRLRVSGLVCWRGKGFTINRSGCLPATWLRRRHFESALPDRSAVKLDRQPVRRIDCPFVCTIDPDPPGIIDPGPRRLADIIQYIELPPVLRDERRIARCPEAQQHALISTVQVDTLHL